MTATADVPLLRVRALVPLLVALAFAATPMPSAAQLAQGQLRDSGSGVSN